MEAAPGGFGRRRIGSLRNVAAALLTAVLLAQRPDEFLPLLEPAGRLFPEPPSVRAPEADIRLEEVTARNGWQAERVVVTREELLTDPMLWNAMFFGDWDRVAGPLRTEAMSRLLTRYRRYANGPSTWVGMSPADWDAVPQPVRAMAFMNMIARWESCLAVAQRHGLDRTALVRRLRAVAMAESWFQHRALNENRDGSTDVGLAQATTATRSILRARARSGLSLHLEDEDYFDPLNSAYVLVYWFDLMLDETGNDIDMATRAYHVGSARARKGDGTDYLEGVASIERRFMSGASRSPAWRFMQANAPQVRLDATEDSAPACPRPEVAQ